MSIVYGVLFVFFFVSGVANANVTDSTKHHDKMVAYSFGIAALFAIASAVASL